MACAVPCDTCKELGVMEKDIYDREVERLTKIREDLVAQKLWAKCCSRLAFP